MDGEEKKSDIAYEYVATRAWNTFNSRGLPEPSSQI
jgi:hypothetical protein